MKSLLILIFIAVTAAVTAQPATVYTVDFTNAVHHEAQIDATFTTTDSGVFTFEMSRSSPGRYALHEFAKNVYKVSATNGAGTPLEITRPNPYQWQVANHDGTVKVQYILFANHGDGTYSQIDESHAHLNMPATFMYAPSLSSKPMEVTFNVRQDLNWKVATQLKTITATTYSAPDLQYFMDSPTEVSDYALRNFFIDDQEIRFVLHHQGTDEELDAYFNQVKRVVEQEAVVYGELPRFDYGTYTFLACYVPNASGDGMEHRNSTIIPSETGLATGAADNIGTVAHEFFHAWNVERIRPQSLKPFKFDQANMSGELWFAEGFTSYYTHLIQSRAGLLDHKGFLNDITRSFNYVWNSPGRQYFSPVEMSYQAPFVDAARSVDEVNRGNTFISYYNYGSMLGLALDLSLRSKGLTLDDYMKAVWAVHGKTELPYTNSDLQKVLASYAGDAFATDFFDNYIYNSEMPDYKTLFAAMGIELHRDLEKGTTGMRLNDSTIASYPTIDSPAYLAGLTKNDVITSVNNVIIDDTNTATNLLKDVNPGDIITINYNRYGKEKTTQITVTADRSYSFKIVENPKRKIRKLIEQRRGAWLDAR